jgi:integrase
MHAWATEHEPDAADLLLFLASTGWRFSEATPLTPAAVEDFGDSVVTIDGQEVIVPQVWVSVLGVHRRDEDDRIVYVDGEAKSAAGVRRINLPPAAAQMVRRRVVGRKPADLLFTNARGRRWHSNNFLEREFQRILDGAGIAKQPGMGPHYLRHTQVGMLDRAGVGLPKMQRRIGHENISTTLGVYGGMIDNSLSVEELVRMDALVAPKQTAGTIVSGEVISGSVAELD